MYGVIVHLLGKNGGRQRAIPRHKEEKRLILRDEEKEEQRVKII